MVRYSSAVIGFAGFCANLVLRSRFTKSTISELYDLFKYHILVQVSDESELNHRELIAKLTEKYADNWTGQSRGGRGSESERRRRDGRERRMAWELFLLCCVCLFLIPCKFTSPLYFSVSFLFHFSQRSSTTLKNNSLILFSLRGIDFYNLNYCFFLFFNLSFSSVEFYLSHFEIIPNSIIGGGALGKELS